MLRYSFIRQENFLRVASTSTNQQLTLWPSIGHYSSRISPIAEVEEQATATVASSTQTIATISHGGQMISTSISPPLYQENVIWNTGVENLPIQQDDDSSSKEASLYKDVEQLSRNNVAVVPGRVTEVRGRFKIELDLE